MIQRYTVGAFLFVLAGTSYASLIDDTVFFDIQSPVNWDVSTPSAEVGAGIEATVLLQGNPYFSLDITDSSIILTHIDNSFGVPFSFGASEVLTVSDMDWVGSPGRIIGVDVATVDWLGIDASNVAFTDDSVTLTFGNVGASVRAAGAVLTIDIQAEHIPTPSTVALLGLGALGIGWISASNQRARSNES